MGQSRTRRGTVKRKRGLERTVSPMTYYLAKRRCRQWSTAAQRMERRKWVQGERRRTLEGLSTVSVRGNSLKNRLLLQREMENKVYRYYIMFCPVIKEISDSLCC